MDNVYFFIILLLGIGIPLLLHKPLKQRIENVTVLIIIEVFTGLAVSFVGFVLPFYFFFSDIEYPTVSKAINDEYYFEQTEYGAAWTDAGKHLNFYKKRHYWFDKKVGHIKWLWGTEDISAVVENDTVPNFKRLVLKERNILVLDTSLNFDQKFDFSYLVWRK